MQKEEVYYKAMLSRDPRFDGKFFIGVKTTKVYCRPVCPAKPLRKNAVFFDSFIEAEQAGFRPCMRCKPENAPSFKDISENTSLIKKVLPFLKSDDFFEIPNEDFAKKFNVTDRHIRRVFAKEFGLTHTEIARIHRLNFSRKLLIETNIPVHAVAYQSGFNSIRRFNDAFKSRFHQVPGEIRRNNKSNQVIKLYINYRPPYHWEHILQYYRNHILAPFESVNDTSYSRLIEINREIARIVVTHEPDKNAIVVTVQGEESPPLFEIVNHLKRMFDTDCDPSSVQHILSKNKHLAAIMAENEGIRIPGSWSVFEAGVFAILGQLVSMKQARNLVKQLITACGKGVYFNNEAHYLFPTPEQVIHHSLDEVKTTRIRKNTLRNFAQFILDNPEQDLRLLPDNELHARLISIKGIGKWTADVIMMRAFNITTVMPSTDLIIKRALELHPEIDPKKLQPWSSYAAFLLWHKYAPLLSKAKN
ncbi:MAG: helix-turn-helix domain-containing protein [Bacteroidia bacterium]|jgi:AraC family transcriptional regulator of adaptative response / DNA-3-methyladenine glycosylase II|nr:helix-turn-helix domain-containing protein [Bacteroidia bacterium]